MLPRFSKSALCQELTAVGSVAPNHSLTFKSVNLFKMVSSRVMSRSRISGLVRSRSSDVLSKASCDVMTGAS